MEVNRKITWKNRNLQRFQNCSNAFKKSQEPFGTPIIFVCRNYGPMDPYYAPCMVWNIYLRNWVIYGVNIGKYYIWLVVWNIFSFPIQLGMSSSQLTNSFIFFRGVGQLNHQPDIHGLHMAMVFLPDTNVFPGGES